MLLSGSAFVDLLPSIIHPVDDAQLTFLEGGAYDLRLASVLRPRGQACLIGASRRSLPPYEPVRCQQGFFNLTPGFYLLQTHEALTMPPAFRGFISPRTSFFRAGASLSVSSVAPGFSGKLAFGLTVSMHLKLERLCHVAALTLHSLASGATAPYAGIWSGDKITTSGPERGH